MIESSVPSTSDLLSLLTDFHAPKVLPDEVNIRINRAALEYEHIIILDPTFHHEVAGFSGEVKYLFPGISGPNMIHVVKAALCPKGGRNSF